ncbi:MAG: ATP-dependent DNA ligase [Gemmatimonadota bacterium]|jgi:DNA ligase-1
MLLHDIASASAEVSGLTGRHERVARLARVLDRLAGDEIAVGVAWLSGRLLQGRIGVGYATLRDVLPVEPAPVPSLTVADVHALLDRLAEVSGTGSVARRGALLRELLGRATEVEQGFLVPLLAGELRHGAGEGLVIEAVAEAAGAPADRVRRAVMLRGDVPAVARTALERGPGALATEAIRLFRPVKPMLAATAEGVEDALERLGEGGQPVLFEHKYDGARLQVHRRGDEVRIYTRRLNDETDALPEVVEAALSLPIESAVLDAEALALRPDGSPRPFQETMRRFGRTRRVEEAMEEVPLTPFFFDLLHLDGLSLLDRPTEERVRALDGVVPPAWRIPRLRSAVPEEAERFLRDARSAGHEGLMAKAPGAPYAAGRRGAAWLKIKPTFTADLVVLAAEWGSGRRKGKLSNIWLGARDATGAHEPPFVMVGKTFKGMTDEMLAWQTRRFLEIERGRRGRAVLVRPEVVVEVAFDGLQRSPRYPGGVALRFARVRGYREDKEPDEADSLERLVELHRSWGGDPRS